MRYLPQTMITTPNIETLRTLYSGTLDPYGAHALFVSVPLIVSNLRIPLHVLVGARTV